jgi:hypothetical protein
MGAFLQGMRLLFLGKAAEGVGTDLKDSNLQSVVPELG